MEIDCLAQLYFHLVDEGKGHTWAQVHARKIAWLPLSADLENENAQTFRSGRSRVCAYDASRTSEASTRFGRSAWKTL